MWLPDTATIIVTVYALTPTANQYSRMHWAAQRRLVRAWWAAFNNAILLAHIAPNHPPWPRVKRLVSVQSFRTADTVDATNLIGGMKPMEDALVLAGLLVDDGPNWCQWNAPRLVPVGRNGTKATIVRLDPIEP